MTSPSVDINYPLLKIYAYYRTGLSCLLLAMFGSSLAPKILGTYVPELFLYTALAYAVLSILTLLILWQRHYSPTNEQIFVILFIDIVALVLLIHASGGLNSGLGFLLLVTTATGGICLTAQASNVLAALGTLLVLTQTLYLIQEGDGDSRNLFAAGTLGTMLFACSLLFNYLSNKLRLSSAEAASQAEHAARLQQMAQMIVERMQTGIVVAAPTGKVEFINQSATRLLNWPMNNPAMELSDVVELEAQYQHWQANPHGTKTPDVKVAHTNNEVRLRFADLSTEPQPTQRHEPQRTQAHKRQGSQQQARQQASETLIFVEDARSLHREAQSLKLASLGRLTASIAHEIRNPLGSISHAGQLLAESPNLDPADRRLTEIIDTNAKRVNQIIENVLQLSRRRPTKPEPIQLKPWLQQFIDDYLELLPKNESSATAGTAAHKCPPAISIIELDKDSHTRIDTSQLAQVLTNLIDNGLRHSLQATGKPQVTLKLGIDSVTELPFLLVIDEGKGIPDTSLSHIFEPFYTTEATGSGLGLYLSKELCEANHASLNYIKDTYNKSCFRIDFAHPNRMF
ncbi:histidine kinase [Aestuariicella hydrocarbonica]|uniref:histidine kinase n=1 Tax=Pseudomaricurvus hydrocarbonicus TaxID=1470433 RepID=A0A9E5MK63_9GAMM|nr:ATP-binding protein [Aestuariicella hydrocarbonica]NHO64957.1 histidine kinase [Aestuariicella hydrocarbonica]